MPTLQIARGTSANVPTTYNPATTGGAPFGWALIGPVGYWIYSTDADTRGYNVSVTDRSNAIVTVPADAPLANFSLSTYPLDGMGGDYRSFGNFDVITGEGGDCPTLAVTLAGAEFLATERIHYPDGSFSPNGVWRYTWNYTLTGPDANRYQVILVDPTGRSSNSGPTTVSVLVAGEETFAGTIKIVGLHPGDDCVAEFPVSVTAGPVYHRVQCLDGNCVGFATTDNTAGFATVDDCLASGCGFSGDGWYCVDSAPVHITSSNEWSAADNPTPRYGTEAECPCYSGPVYWCANGHVQSGTTPPSGVTTYPSEQACINAGCVICPPIFTRFRCNSQGICESFPTSNPNAGFADCEGANCSGTTEPPDYWRHYCDENGVCQSFLTFDPTEGYEDCEHANCGAPTEPEPCDYLSHPIANITPSGSANLSFSLSRLQNEGWQLVVTHALNGTAQTNPILQITEDTWNWSVPRVLGTHHFIAELSKEGCSPNVTELSLTVTGDGTGGSGTPYWCVNGNCVQTNTPPGGAIGPYATAGLCNTACSQTGNGGDCPPCPPNADPLSGGCSPSIAIQIPAASASLRNFARVRVQLSDPNEQTNPCHHNYSRLCNHEPDGPALQLSLGEYTIPLIWKHISGTPLNGVWETLLNTRDFSNGAHELRLSTRGVGCCRVYSAVSVSLANTLQGNIFYRDTQAQASAGFVIPDAMIGVETRALEENTSRRYWEQWGMRSGLSLDGAYNHDDWPKHQPVLPILGAQWAAQGSRFERHNYSAHVTLRLPLSRHIRFRRKWTPQFYLSAFDLHAQTVAKIRPIASGRHYLFTTNPAKVWIYDGTQATLYANFSVEPTVDDHELSTGENENDFDSIDRSGSNIYAPNATDCAVYSGEATGDKVYVVVPPSEELPGGEVFAFDHDSQEVALEYGIRRENRVPRFIEVVGNRVICLYVHDPAVSLPIASRRTRAYDLTFATPTLLWQLPDTATFCSVDEATLFVACNSKLYSTDGKTAPALVHDFGEAITTATKTFVGLANGQLWKKINTSWVLVHTRPGALGGAANWNAGTIGETQTEDARGIVAGEGAWLVGERDDGTWYDERELRIPLDLTGKTVTRVSALDHFSVTVAPPTATDDAVQLPQRDERLLIGTADSGLLFVYQRSALSEKDGALPVSHDTTPRLFPFPRRE
ncbi:hypothetical protein IAD21_00707 [Abditibacteriota bacterium]|nr:hypothetical protein IAD21_00707 [Abditibacteriota bacterium]